MIGLEYVLKLWDMQQDELAERLGIKKQNINYWVTGKRNIPKKYLPKLAEIFNIPEKYFQKELKYYHKERIQLMKLYGINDETQLGYGVVDAEFEPSEEFERKQEESVKKEMIKLNSKREDIKELIDKISDLEFGNTEYGATVVLSQIAGKQIKLEFIENVLSTISELDGYRRELAEEILTSLNLLNGKALPYKYTEQSNIDFYNECKEKYGYEGEMEDIIDREGLAFIYKMLDLIKTEQERLRIENEKFKTDIEKYNHYD